MLLLHVFLASLIFLLEGVGGTESTKQKVLKFVTCSQFNNEAWAEVDHDAVWTNSISLCTCNVSSREAYGRKFTDKSPCILDILQIETFIKNFIIVELHCVD
jgi:hypothetical protein